MPNLGLCLLTWSSLSGEMSSPQDSDPKADLAFTLLSGATLLTAVMIRRTGKAKFLTNIRSWKLSTVNSPRCLFTLMMIMWTVKYYGPCIIN